MTIPEVTRNDIREFVRSQILEIRGLDELLIDDHTPLFAESSEHGDAALDSLDALELGLAIEERFDIGIPEDVDVRTFGTIDSIVSYIEMSLIRGLEK